jgi:hypothetical protein
MLTKHKDFQQLNNHRQDFLLVVLLVVRQDFRMNQELLRQYLDYLSHLSRLLVQLLWTEHP